MKLKNLGIIIFSISLLFLSACKEESTNEPNKNISNTSLELTFKDNLGNNQNNVIVKLYSSQTDWSNGTNQVGATKATDAGGKVIFENLSDIKYFWFAEKGCINNVNGAVTTTLPLTGGVKNTLTAILSETGTILLTSTSSNPYRVYVNGTAIFEMNGGTSRSINYVQAGSYTVRVLQLSGYVLYPTDKSYTAVVNCGGTSVITYP